MDEKSHGYWCPRAVDSDNMSAMTFMILILYIFNCLYGDGDIFNILCLWVPISVILQFFNRSFYFW